MFCMADMLLLRRRIRRSARGGPFSVVPKAGAKRLAVGAFQFNSSQNRNYGRILKPSHFWNDMTPSFRPSVQCSSMARKGLADYSTLLHGEGKLGSVRLRRMHESPPRHELKEELNKVYTLQRTTCANLAQLLKLDLCRQGGIPATQVSERSNNTENSAAQTP
jgi:hypothetical protein